MMEPPPITPGEIETCAHCMALADAQQRKGRIITFPEIRFIHCIFCRP